MGEVDHDGLAVPVILLFVSDMAMANHGQVEILDEVAAADIHLEIGTATKDNHFAATRCGFAKLSITSFAHIVAGALFYDAFVFCGMVVVIC